MPEKGEKGKGFFAEKSDTKKSLTNMSQELKDQLDTYDSIDKTVNKIFKVRKMSLVAAQSANELDGKANKSKVKSGKLDADALAMAQDVVNKVKQRLAGFRKLQSAARLLNLIAKANPWLLVAGIIAGIVVAFSKFNKMVADTRKELGVSAAQAIILQGRFKLLSLQGKLFGLEAEDIKNSFNAIRENFGGIDQAT
jgi:hypothetical protein